MPWENPRRHRRSTSTSHRKAPEPVIFLLWSNFDNHNVDAVAEGTKNINQYITRAIELSPCSSFSPTSSQQHPKQQHWTSTEQTGKWWIHHCIIYSPKQQSKDLIHWERISVFPLSIFPNYWSHHFNRPCSHSNQAHRPPTLNAILPQILGIKWILIVILHFIHKHASKLSSSYYNKGIKSVFFLFYKCKKLNSVT